MSELNVIFQYKELIVTALGLSTVYWKLVQRIGKIEDKCSATYDPFFTEMQKDAARRILSAAGGT